MKTRFTDILVALLLIAQGGWAQEATNAQPSESLTEIAKSDNCTVYSFNYPSVSVNGEQTVLSSALFHVTDLSVAFEGVNFTVRAAVFVSL